MASVTLEQSVRPWLSRFGLHTAMRVTCVRYRSVLDACMQARHGWQIELMKRPAQRRIFCSFNGGLIAESSPDATESIYVLVEHTDIALMQALRRAPRPLAGVCSIVLTLELHTLGYLRITFLFTISAQLFVRSAAYALHQPVVFREGVTCSLAVTCFSQTSLPGPGLALAEYEGSTSF